MKAWIKKWMKWISTASMVLLLSFLLLPGLVFPQPELLTEEEFKTLFPFKAQFAELENGTRIHYVDEGQGPVLLLLHGNPTSAYLYRDMIAALKTDYRVIAPDYPGFGQSTAPADYAYSAQEQADTMISFFDQMELDEVVIMVQDWGGPIGLNLVQQRPDQFSGLIIGNTWAWPLEGQLRYELFSWFMGGPIGEWLNENHNGVVHVFLRRGMAQELTEQEYAGYFRTFIEGDRRPATVFPRELIEATPFLSKVEQGMGALAEYPALILWGERDFAFQQKERQRFEAFFPHHQTRLLAAAGHFLQDDSPTEIVAAIRHSYPSAK